MLSGLLKEATMGDNWYVRKGQKALGPLSEEQLRKALVKGRISSKTAVREGLTGPWTSAAQALARRDRQNRPL